MLAELGLLYRESGWPHGLMCAECPHIFREGERYTTDLYAFSEDVAMVRVLCVPCATGSRSESGQSAPRA
jgi:hypothetical protein